MTKKHTQTIRQQGSTEGKKTMSPSQMRQTSDFDHEFVGEDGVIISRYVDMKDVNLAEHVQQGYLSHPLPAMAFIQQDFDKRQYWLRLWDGTKSYQTSVSRSKWRKMNTKTQAALIEIAVTKMYEERQND